MKQLKKSKDKILSGVCGGLAEYFNIDPTIVRLGMCVVTVIKIPLGLIFYAAALILMPSSEGESFFNEYRNISYTEPEENGSTSEKSDKTAENPGKNADKKESKSAGRKTSVPHSDEEFNKYFDKKNKNE